MKDLTFIMGPCALESEEINMEAARRLKQMETNLNEKIAPYRIEIIYKSCYHKANRTDLESFHGMGIKEGLKLLRLIKAEFNMKVTSDVHSIKEIEKCTGTLDIFQVPQSLSRYTSILLAAAQAALGTGAKVSLKKGVFMNENELRHAHAKLCTFLPENQIILVERGNKFGYDTMVVDPLNIKMMKTLGSPVCIDATHPSRDRANGIDLARVGVVMGADHVFIECHPDPDKALCDGKTSLVLDDQLEKDLEELIRLKILFGERQNGR